MSEARRGAALPTKITCPVCEQLTDDIGPWCRLYVDERFCPPLIALRRRIREADAVGDGPLVNALCQWIRMNTYDDWVP